MLTIQPVPAFTDNYIWLLQEPDSREAFVVDPGDAAPVEERLQELGLTLAGILITHHHFDHVGGLNALKEHHQCTVYGPHNPAISGIDHVVSAGDSITVLGHKFDILEVPGHTLDHIAYFSEGGAGGAGTNPPLLFCGDTLFAGGCGRVFEGTFPMMLASLESLAQLPGSTEVYCAHEYTLANLAFAQAVEPDNPDLASRVTIAKQTRQQNQPTVPSTIALEQATNPFLRAHSEQLREALRQQGRLEEETAEGVFATVRGWKDNF
ncbi:MAG: hydroxyacylglutathione hydrolase [Halioglobus sp.]